MASLSLKGRDNSTIGEERRSNPSLAKTDRAEFMALMNSLNLSAPTHLTEALRTNMSGGKTVRQLLAEASARVPFMPMDELHRRLAVRPNDFMIIDVREKDAYAAGHVPSMEILSICEFGKISALAAATLRELGFQRAVALDGGMAAWRETGNPEELG